MTEALIDLGFDRDAPEPGPGGMTGWFRRTGPVTLRPWVLAVVVLALVLAVTGGSAAQNPRLTEIFTVPMGILGSFTINGDTLYVLAVGPTDTTLTAYRMRDGLPLWTTKVGPVPAVGEHAGLERAGDGLMVVTGEDASLLSQATVYDPATGRLLWTAPGGPIAPPQAGRVLLSRALVTNCADPPCDRLDFYPATPYELTARNPRTGEAFWSLQLAPEENARLTIDARRLATIDTSHHLVIRDLATGAVTATHQLPPDASQWSPVLADDLVLVQKLTDISMVRFGQRVGVLMTAYDARTLAPRWTFPESPEFAAFVRCGPLLCASTMDGTWAIDRANGEIRWSDASWAGISELTDEYLLAYPVTDRRAWVIEARTGRKLFSTGRWSAEGRAGLVMVQWHEDRTRAWFGVLRIDLGGVQPLTVVSGIRRPCAPALAAKAGWLACQTTDDRVRVWRLVF